MNALELQGIQRNVKIQSAADKWEGGNIPLIARRIGARQPDPRYLQYSERDHLRIEKMIQRNTFLQSEEGIAFLKNLRELELRKKFEPMFKASLKRAEERVLMPGGPESYPDKSLGFIGPGSWPTINNEYRKYVNSLPERSIYKRNVLAQESVRNAHKDLQDAINTPAIDTHDENLFGKKKNKLIPELKRLQKKAKKMKIRITKTIRGKRVYKTIKELKKELKKRIKKRIKN